MSNSVITFYKLNESEKAQIIKECNQPEDDYEALMRQVEEAGYHLAPDGSFWISHDIYYMEKLDKNMLIKKSTEKHKDSIWERVSFSERIKKNENLQKALENQIVNLLDELFKNYDVTDQVPIILNQMIENLLWGCPDFIYYPRAEKERDAIDMFSVGDEFNFGRYNASPIRWRVINKKENTLLVIATNPLDSKKRSSLQWLNEFFYRYSFSDIEKKCIIKKNKYSDKLNYVSCFKVDVCDIYRAEKVFIQEQPDFWYWNNYDECVCISKYIQNNINENSRNFKYFVPALYLKATELLPQVSELEKGNNLDFTLNSRIKQLYVGDKFEFGEYKGKVIVWRVLKKTRFILTVISEENICDKAFNSDRTTNQWELCTLRNWLNGEFYNAAFNDIEKKYIIGHYDPIFLLGKKEANIYFKNDKERANGLWWWLRSPIRTTRTRVERVNGNGSFSKDGSCVDDIHGGVRPALEIRLQP